MDQEKRGSLWDAPPDAVSPSLAGLDLREPSPTEASDIVRRAEERTRGRRRAYRDPRPRGFSLFDGLVFAAVAAVFMVLGYAVYFAGSAAFVVAKYALFLFVAAVIVRVALRRRRMP